jgi:hypothetical protein
LSWGTLIARFSFLDLPRILDASCSHEAMQINPHETEPNLAAVDRADIRAAPATCAHNHNPPVVGLERGCGRSEPPESTLPQPHAFVLPRRAVKAWPGSDSGRGVYVPLGEVLTAPFTTDAHFVQYSAPTHPFRLLSTAYVQLPTPPRVNLMVIDVDSPEAHSKRIEATDAWFCDENSKLEQLLARMPGSFVYRTTGGYRIVYTLGRPFEIATQADEVAWKVFYIRSLVHLAREFDIVGDATCKPWNWLFRVPRATRNRLRGPETPFTMGDPAAIGVWTYEPG